MIEWPSSLKVGPIRDWPVTQIPGFDRLLPWQQEAVRAIANGEYPLISTGRQAGRQHLAHVMNVLLVADRRRTLRTLERQAGHA